MSYVRNTPAYSRSRCNFAMARNTLLLFRVQASRLQNGGTKALNPVIYANRGSYERLSIIKIVALKAHAEFYFWLGSQSEIINSSVLQVN